MLDQVRANEALSWLHGGGAPPTITGPLHVRQMTANGTATANGTEAATGGGYTSGTGAPSISSWATAASGSQATSAAVQITNYPRSETVVGIELWSSDGTPKRVELGALSSPKSMAAGDTLSYASGAISSTMS